MEKEKVLEAMEIVNNIYSLEKKLGIAQKLKDFGHKQGETIFSVNGYSDLQGSYKEHISVKIPDSIKLKVFELIEQGYREEIEKKEEELKKL